MLPRFIRRVRSQVYATGRRALSAGATYSGAYRLAGRRYGGLGVIFTLHRVVEPGRPVLWPGFALHADVLDRLLATTRRMGWEVISLDEMHRRVSGNGARGDGAAGRFACFTLDDGYLDNLHVALPVFRRHQAPFCVYLSTGLVDRSAFYWWGGLEEIVATSDRVDWEAEGGARLFRTQTWEEKRSAYDALSTLCERAGPEAVRALLRRYRVDCRAVMDRDLLTAEQARMLAAEPLATIGAHSVAHERLTAMSEADAFRDLADSRRIIEGWIGAEVRHLAYPFGAADACGPREFELARRAGYLTGVTTLRGNVFSEHREHLTALPRREVPTDVVRLRNALFGIESVLNHRPRLTTGEPDSSPAPARSAPNGETPGRRADVYAMRRSRETAGTAGAMPESTPAGPTPEHHDHPDGEHRAAAKRVVRNSLWLVAQPLVMNAISLLATAYIARTLGRTNYGRFVFALSFIAMFTPLTNLGLRFLSIRHLATSRGQDVSSYIGRIWVLRLILALAGAGLAVSLVGLAGRSEETRQVVYLASFIIALQAITTTATDVFQAFENMRLVAQVQFVSGLVLTVLSVVVLYLGLGLNGLMGAYVVGNLSGAVLAAYYLYSRFTVPRLSIDLGFWRTSLAQAAPLFIPNFVREAGSRLGVVMLGGLVDQGAVGSYGAASTLVERVAVIPDGVCSALFPTMAAAFQRSPADAAALYRKFFRYFLIMGLPLAVGATVLARPIIELIYGDRYEQSPLVLAVLGWGLFLTFFVQLQGWSAAAIHQEKKAFFAPIIATGVYLPLCLVLVPRYEEVGLAAASICMAAVLLLLFRSIVRAHLSRRGVEPGLLLRVLAANAAMAGVVHLASEWPVLLSIPLGVLVYGVALVGLRAVPLSEVTELFGRVRRRLGIAG